jgi:hypothetical protein
MLTDPNPCQYEFGTFISCSFTRWGTFKEPGCRGHSFIYSLHTEFWEWKLELSYRYLPVLEIMRLFRAALTQVCKASFSLGCATAMSSSEKVESEAERITMSSHSSSFLVMEWWRQRGCGVCQTSLPSQRESEGEVSFRLLPVPFLSVQKHHLPWFSFNWINSVHFLLHF